MTATYPSGYASDLVTMDQVRAKHKARYHPEVWRRVEAIMVAAQGLLGLNDEEGLCGIGGGARTREEQAASYARDPNTFAPPDSSFHQVWTWLSGATGAQAIDWVGRSGRHQEAWKWLRDNGGLYGLKTFWNVNGEPWHSQCIELPNSVSAWKNLGKPDPSAWVFPGEPSAPVTPPAAADYGLWPLNPNKPAIQQGSLGDAVRYAQRVMNDKSGKTLTVDGEYGPATGQAVLDLQNWFSMPDRNGKVDKDEWDMLDALVGVTHVVPPPYVPPTPEPTPPTPTPPAANSWLAPEGSYWVKPGDSPYGTEALVYGGSGADWAQHFTQQQFMQANYSIPLPGIVGVGAKVLQGEGAYNTIARMYPGENAYAPGRLDRYYALNGGKGRILHPGDTVFLDPPK